MFTRSLRELLPPDEVEEHFPQVWEQGVDRWYGQTASAAQMEHIKWYQRQDVICMHTPETAS